MKKALYFLLASICLSVVLNIWQCSRQPQESVVIEHDTVWRDTTIYKPVPTESKETGETIYVKVPAGGDTLGTATSLTGADHGDRLLDSLYPLQCWNQEPVPRDRPDSIEVPLPVEQKRYDDSLYTAWVSGYRPALDSIRLYQSEIVTTVTTTVVKPTPLITFGIQVGAGVGIIHRQPDIYIGFGGQINFWRK